MRNQHDIFKNIHLACGVPPELKALVPLKKLEGGGERQKEEVNTMEI